MVFAQISASMLSAASAAGEELTARPTEPVLAAPLSDPSAEPQLTALASSEAATALDRAEDPLHALIASASRLSVAEADALLHEAYDAYPTPTTRSRAFGAAAEAASAAGRHELALAWTDWAIREGEQAPERDSLLADRLAEAIGVALAAGNPVLARRYVRQAAGHAPGGRDDPDGRGVVFERLDLTCPDVIDEVYVRIRAAAEQTEPGLLAAPSAECAYIPIQPNGDGGFRIHAVRSFIDLETRTREVVEQGLEGREVEARRVIVRRLSTTTTVVEPLFVGDVAEGFLGYARYERRGEDDVAAFAYATAARDDVFYAGSASGRDWAWPPEDLGARAEIGLRGVLEADGGE